MESAGKKYINAPMELFVGFLESPEKRNNCLFNVINYEIGKYYDRRRVAYLRLDEVCSRIGVNYYGKDPDGFIEQSKAIFRQYNGQNKVHFSLSTEQLSKFFYGSKTEDECVLLMAYLALKSIAGIKPYCKTNRYLWLARMDCKMKAVKSVDELSEQVRVYASTYQQRRLRDLLEKYYNALFWSKSLRGGRGGLKGFYFTLTLSPKDFMSALMESKSSPKRCARAIEFESAMQSAFKMINI